MKSFKASSVSTSEPVTVSEVKEFLRIQTTAEDRLLESLIKVSRRNCENRVKRALVPTSYQLTIDVFENTINLPRPPLSTLSSLVVITYTDTGGNIATCDSTNYTVDYMSEPGKVYLAYDADWPDDVRDVENAIKINYRSGYTTANIPDEIKTWIMMDVGDRFENRESIQEGIKLEYLNRNFKDGLLDAYDISQELSTV